MLVAFWHHVCFHGPDMNFPFKVYFNKAFGSFGPGENLFGQLVFLNMPGLVETIGISSFL